MNVKPRVVSILLLMMAMVIRTFSLADVFQKNIRCRPVAIYYKMKMVFLKTRQRSFVPPYKMPV